MCSNPRGINHKQMDALKPSQNTPQGNLPGGQLLIPSLVKSISSPASPHQRPQGHRLPGPSPSPGVTAIAPQHLQQHPLTAKRNPDNSQGDFQIPSATSLIQIQPSLPREVAKMHAQIQKGILFPANNYPAFLQLSLPTLKITNISQTPVKAQDLQPTD